LLVGALGGACSSGGSSNGKAPDISKIATATLPAKLPDPQILSNSSVQTAGGSGYIIKDGDTLAGIASKLGIALDDLLAANPGLDPQTLRAGQSIKLPANTDAPPPAATTTTRTTTTQTTSTTATPASKSATASAATDTPAPVATDVPPTDVPATDVPATATEGPAPQGTPGVDATATPSSVGQTYTVLDGDFPASIAEKFGITVDALLAANPGLNPTDMHVGDVIIIPPKPAG
jgi:LysM repeat protein